MKKTISKSWVKAASEFRQKNCITLQGPVSYFFLWTHEMGFGTCNIVKGTNLLLGIVALHADTASFYSFYVQHSSITLTVTGSCFSSRESPHFRFCWIRSTRESKYLRQRFTTTMYKKQPHTCTYTTMVSVSTVQPSLNQEFLCT